MFYKRRDIGRKRAEMERRERERERERGKRYSDCDLRVRQLERENYHIFFRLTFVAT